MKLKLITAPTDEPVVLADAKLQCKVDVTDDDTLIGTLITAAREQAEHRTRRALMTQTWELALDAFPYGRIFDPPHVFPQNRAIDLPKSPVQSIASIKYTDVNGEQQTLDPSAYALDTYGIVHRVLPVGAWPATARTPNAVIVQYVAGYANVGAVPASIKSWIKIAVATLYDNRDAIVSGSKSGTVPELPRDFLDGLLDPYRIPTPL